MSVLALVTCGF